MSAGQLFTLPGQFALDSASNLQAGSKLYFYVTTTSTPKSVFQDRALGVAHANPVVADGNGKFAAIWLNNDALYRAVLKTSADVTQFTWDDLGPNSASDLASPTLAGNNVFTGQNKISAAEVRLLLDETDGGTDKRLWDIDIDGAVLKLRTRTDADGAGVTMLTATRGSGTAITSVNLQQTWQYQGNPLASVITGSFTATLTGMTAATTGLVFYRIAGGICTLYVEANITGTSNTTALTLTGLPAACQPVTTGQRDVICYGVGDNTQSLQGLATIDGTGAASPGTIAFTLFNTNVVANRIQAGAVFTNSGTKGLVNRWQVAYPL